ncbi:UDP-N-acetylmuramate--L-alanine ligase [Candidatus Nomurabacteria bacterium]|nr:UDP-N-acetylmuramate--L-alanine ligase [Candidatus Nomurabacteria bacterium]
MENILNKSKNIHFIGIGGIGVSAVAKMMILEGKSISGSDMSDSQIIQELIKSGVKINIGHKKENLPKNTDLVIYTIAITDENPELKEARNRGIRCITYPEALHEISKDKYTIAISGTHGKTTTTAMIVKILIDAELDPTVIVGSILKDLKSNFIAGESKYFVVEACEYRRSFLNINPSIVVVTNIDNDHLDYYKDLADIQKAFGEFALKLPTNGHLIFDFNDKVVSEALNKSKCDKQDFSVNFSKIPELKVPGKHNIRNASAALSVAKILGIDEDLAKKSLAEFSGTWRRFEFKGKTKNSVKVYDDYAHHPTEVKASLSGAREKFKNQRIFVVFQPHLYSRTKLLLNDFANAFENVDEVILAPIYAAREPFDSSISSEILAQKIKETGKTAKSFLNFNEIKDYLSENLKSGDILITMGAGDVFKIGESLLT